MSFATGDVGSEIRRVPLDLQPLLLQVGAVGNETTLVVVLASTQDQRSVTAWIVEPSASKTLLPSA